MGRLEPQIKQIVETFPAPGACEDGASPGPWEFSSAGQPEQYDVMGFQECKDANLVLGRAGLLSSYTVRQDILSESQALCMAYLTASWSMLDSGVEIVAEDAPDQYFGKRSAQWMRLQHISSGKVLLFLNHHGPTPVNSGGACGGSGTAFKLLKLIAATVQQGDTIVLVGDFNADDSCQTIRRLQERLSGANKHGLDNIFSNVPVSAIVSADNLGNGGSDHDALSVVLNLGGDAQRPLPISPSSFPVPQFGGPFPLPKFGGPLPISVDDIPLLFSTEPSFGLVALVIVTLLLLIICFCCCMGDGCLG